MSDPTQTLWYDFEREPSLEARAGLGPTLDITRATTASFVDVGGIIRTAQAGEARFTGARRVENLSVQSEDISTTWQAQASGTVTGTDQFNFVGADSYLQHAGAYQQSTNGVFTLSATMSTNTAGNGKKIVMDLFDSLDGSDTVTKLITLTTTPTRYSLTADWTASATFSGYVGFAFNRGATGRTIEAGDILIITDVQLENTSGSTGPNEYIPTTTAAVAKLYGASEGLLVEEARTNLCLQSEDFANGSWVEAANLAAVVGNEATAPDGTATADLLIDDASTGTGTPLTDQGITVSTGTAYTQSCFFKADGIDWVRMDFLNAALAINAYFDLTNGAVGATTGANNTSEFIEDYGNGWYRCGIVFDSDAADPAGFFRVRLADGNGDATVDLDGTSSIFVWGAQLEAGAFPTSYIPTTTVGVPRNKDDINTTSVGWYNASASTVYVHSSVPYVGATNQFSFAVSDGLFSDSLLCYRSSGTASTVNSFAAGGNDGAATAASQWSNGDEKRDAFVLALNDLTYYQDGSIIGAQDTTADLPTIDRLNIGSNYENSQHWNGHIKEIRYYNERKANTWLENASNGNFAESKRHNLETLTHNDETLQHNKQDRRHNRVNMRHKSV